jgi:hypothetical protein
MFTWHSRENRRIPATKTQNHVAGRCMPEFLLEHKDRAPSCDTLLLS